MDAPRRDIPPDRKAMYYGGMAASVIGVLLFLSTFVTFGMNFGNFDNFVGHAQSDMLRAFSGIILIIAGRAAMTVGAKGWAGSGVLLEPKKAREDVEPWNRMAGGMLDDTLSEVGVVKKLEERLEPSEPQVKIRCRKCHALNDESAKFCNQCGSAL